MPITCMFLRGGPAVWFETIAKPQLYKWNNFRSALERTFGGFGALWESRMENKFENCTNDSSDGSLVSKKVQVLLLSQVEKLEMTLDMAMVMSMVVMMMMVVMMIVMMIMMVIMMRIPRSIQRRSLIRIGPRRKVLSMRIK